MIWILAGVILLIFFAVKIRKNRDPEPENSEEPPFPHGNVSIFMDKDGNLHVIPFALDRMKRGKTSEYPLSLENPYTCAELGEVIRQGLNLSGSGKNLTSEEVMRSLGFYDWREYSKGRKSVSVTCQGQEVGLNSTIRRSDGSYAFRVQGYEKVLPQTGSGMTLGNMVLELMKASR